MALRYYDRNELEQVKQSPDILRAELIPSKVKGKYICPDCGKDCVSVWANVGKAAGWQCWKCGAHGNVIDVFMLRDGLTARDAMVAVCDRWADSLRGYISSSSSSSAIQIPSSTVTASDSGGIDAVTAERRRAYCEAAAQRLWRPEGVKGLQYLHDRGFDDDVLRQFCIGYDAACTVDGVLRYGRPSIVIPYSAIFKDYFVARFIQPMVDAASRETKCLGCKGTGEKHVFNVGAIWSKKYDAVIVCEGWADALSIIQAARTISTARVSAIATGGAMLHSGLIDALRDRLASPRLIVAMDADAAGQEGARSLSKALAAVGQVCEIVDGRLWHIDDDCKDANDVLKRYGVEAVAAGIEAMLDRSAAMPDADVKQ